MSVSLSISAPEKPNTAPYTQDEGSHVIIFITCGIIAAILVSIVITVSILMRQKSQAANKRLNRFREVLNPMYPDYPLLGEGDLDIPYDPEWELPRAK